MCPSTVRNAVLKRLLAHEALGTPCAPSPDGGAQGHREGDHDGVVVLATRDDPLHAASDVGYRLAIDSVSKPFMAEAVGGRSAEPSRARPCRT